jgi:hypothetical protein
MNTPPSKAPVSACLIVQDEEHNIPGVLESLAFCDEIVVVDGGSSDRTVELARAGGAKVVENPWPGFAAQRNVSLDAASADWVLEVDADERVSLELRQSIERFLASPPPGVNVVVFPQRHRFLGRLLGPSAKYPAYRTRLFRRSVYRHNEGRHVHEGIEPRERPAVLEGDLHHELASTLHEAFHDAFRYAKLESYDVSVRRDPRQYLVGILLRPTAKVFYRVALDGGWRDGWQGLLKIALDAASDSLVWMLAVARVIRGESRVASPGGEGQVADPVGEGAVAGPGDEGRIAGPQDRPAVSRHFGRRPTGPLKVVGVASSGAATGRALRWLGELAAAGIDVALVSDEPAAPDRIAVQPVRRLSLLRTMRALDVEMQIRTAHAVLPFGPRAKAVSRLLPGALCPRVSGVDEHTEPLVALERLRSCV